MEIRDILEDRVQIMNNVVDSVTASLVKAPSPRITWSIEEEETLKQFVLENKDTMGINNALKEIADRNGWSFHQAKNRWYMRLNPNRPMKDNDMKDHDTKDNDMADSDTTEETSVAPPKGANGVVVEDTAEDVVEESVEQNVHQDITIENKVVEDRTSVVDEPYLRVKVSPITQRQLMVMSLDELFDLLLNVSIQIQEYSNKAQSDNKRLRRDLLIASEEREELRVGYTSLLGVINTARKMALDEGNESLRFKMDNNGNLERVK